ncbi:MAG: SAM-dependent methyltransferase [Clostridiales bacterium]|nr:SAM-dependent methyltransferase [Clostridiales bacterium]
MDNKSSVTSLMSAFVRAYHAQVSENPVFYDSFARRLISDGEYEGMKKHISAGMDFFAPEKKGLFKSPEDALEWLVNTQLAPTVLARARFCEDALRTAVMTGTSQYVIIGAGLDTFAWREPELMKRLTVFEVDYPLTQEDKKKRLAEAGLEAPDGLHFVPVDLSKEDLAAALMAAGFDSSEKTFFGWFGVSYYLTGQQIERMLEAISGFACEGSTLAFDFPDEGLFSSETARVKNMLAMAAAGGEPMKFSASDEQLSSMLEKHSFLVYELLDTQAIDERYFACRDDALDAFENISYALAVIKGTQFINTKEKILLTALRLFAKRGYEAVSVRDIAGRLGITQAALYKHYKNKRDIFESILKRMESDDAERSRRFEVPDGNTPRYEKVCLENIGRFATAQFEYWTQNAFAADFRRMLTLEQYSSPEMSALYRQYVSGGILDYMSEIFSASPPEGSNGKTPEQLALEFYAPLYMLISVYDTARDKSKITASAKKHVEDFLNCMKGTE